MSDNDVETVSKKIGTFLGTTCVPIVKVTGHYLKVIYNNIYNGWEGFSNEIYPEIEILKKNAKDNITECVDDELSDLSEPDETI